MSRLKLTKERVLGYYIMHTTPPQKTQENYYYYVFDTNNLKIICQNSYFLFLLFSSELHLGELEQIGMPTERLRPIVDLEFIILCVQIRMVTIVIPPCPKISQ